MRVQIIDGAAADGLYGAVLTVAPGTPTGEQQLLISARDQAGHQASLDQSGAVQRARSSADRGRESVSHGAQQLAGAGLEGVRLE